MKKALPIYNKELRSYFASPIAYTCITIFLMLTGWYFFSLFAYYSNASLMSSQNPFGMMGEDLSPIEFIFRPFINFTSVVMLLSMPLLTMRLFSEEKKLGTTELLFSYPVTDLEVTAGKLAAAVTVFSAMLLLTLPMMGLLAAYASIDYGPLLTGYLGLLLLGTAFLSLGIFASSITENQIVSASITFGALLLFWMIGWVESFSTGAAASAAAQLSILRHIDGFSKGTISLSDTMYYILFASFFIFATLRVLESHKWRK